MLPTLRETLWACATVWALLAVSAAGAQEAAPVDGAVLTDRADRQVAMTAGQTRVVGQGGLGELKTVQIPRGLRATFCNGSGTGALCRRLVGGAESPPASVPPPYTAAGTVVTVEKALFGFADLHAHPATHLAWGARGARGPQWGLPGMSLAATGSVAADLAACASDNHTGTLRPIVQAARIALVAMRDGPHQPFGAPSFAAWPSAHSTLHQQMHVTMLRRAYDGGLRLMVASATDNQMLDIIWNPEFSLSQLRFALREDADYKSAAEQFDFIRRFVNANADWMAIARTPAEARAAIEANKLAVVLGLELDELSAAAILKLKQDYGVALVMPVHLVNNSFGGAAVYDPFFNVANYVMNGSLFGVESESDLGFRFPGAEQIYRGAPVVGQLLGPIGTKLAEYSRNPQQGHRNRLGLRDEYGLRRLMKAGLLIDVAHMSSAATDSTLALASRPGGPLVPIVYSHGGLRWGYEAGKTPSERGMTVDQLRTLMNTGGIFGLGTGVDESADPPPPIQQWIDRYLEVERSGAETSGAYGRVALGTDLNGMAKQIARSEVALPYPTRAIRDLDWTQGSQVQALSQFLLVGKQFDIRRDGIAHIGMLPDFLAVVRRRAEQLDSGDGADRVPRIDQIFHSAHDFIATWEQATRVAPSVDVQLPSVPLAELDLTLETGTDDLKCGNVMMMAFASGNRMISPPLMIREGQKPHSGYRTTLQILPGTNLREVSHVRFQYLPIQCDIFDTGDTWNIKTLQVTYDVSQGGVRHQGVLAHRRGAPARKLDRGDTWSVYVER